MSLLEFRYLGVRGAQFHGTFSISYIHSRYYVRGYSEAVFCGELSVTDTSFSSYRSSLYTTDNTSTSCSPFGEWKVT